MGALRAGTAVALGQRECLGCVSAMGCGRECYRLQELCGLQECYWLRRKMASFVSQMCEDGHGKNGGKASKLRDAGNAKFAAKEDHDSIKLYTQVLQ